MPGIGREVIEHKLNIRSDMKLVIQKKRNMGKEMSKAAAHKVKKLWDSSFIKKVRFPKVIVNGIMVWKSLVKWKMCGDYTYLNKACPRDPFPLSDLNRFMDVTIGYELLSFKDVFFGYN